MQVLQSRSFTTDTGSRVDYNINRVGREYKGETYIDQLQVDVNVTPGGDYLGGGPAILANLDVWKHDEVPGLGGDAQSPEYPKQWDTFDLQEKGASYGGTSHVINLTGTQGDSGEVLDSLVFSFAGPKGWDSKLGNGYEQKVDIHQIWM